jgi:hypothetical protein
MTFSFSYEFVVQGDRPDGQIVLPHQGPLGIVEGLDYQPVGAWPVIFVCAQHGNAFSRSTQDVLLKEVPDQVSRYSRLWQIECRCAHENCGRILAIYTTGSALADASEILIRVLKANPAIACAGHDLVLIERQMIATRLS